MKRKNLLELRKMTQDEIDKYYMELRKIEYDAGKRLEGIKLRQNIHFLLVTLIKIDRLLNKDKLIVLGDESTRSNPPYIYTATHIGGNDVERIFESIKEHAYLMIGDPGVNYINSTGLILNLNGFIPVETRYKEDRRIAYDRSIELLNNNGSLLIFPEGAYNVFENLPTMGIYPGAVRMAKETGREIIPVAIEQYDKEFVVKIGKNIKVDKEENIEEANEKLKESLSTLKYEIWETREPAKREEYSQEFIDGFRQSIINRDDRGEGYSYTLQDVYETMYHNKKVTSPEEAFNFMNDLKPSKENAFMLR